LFDVALRLGATEVSAVDGQRSIIDLKSASHSELESKRATSLRNSQGHSPAPAEEVDYTDLVYAVHFLLER
jgi:hypothetical protein